MSEDPYKVLGVARDASPDAIRKAYRKLAKELHPDLHPGDKTAEARFKEVSAAYHLLSDAEKRARFDRGEIDASGQEKAPEHPFYRHYAEADPTGRYRSQAAYGDFEDVSDIFSSLFGQRGRAGGGAGGGGFAARGGDLRFHLEVDFLEAANGATRRITLPEGGTLDLTIPAGAKDGTTLRLKGKGAPGVGGGPAGDALVELSVRPHPVFRREGDDIVVELPIGLDEAVLGAKVEVPTIAGRVKMTLRKGANSGDVLRLKGKGIQPNGDQRVILKVVLPETADPALEALMEKWRAEGRADPRAKLWRAVP